MATRQITAKPDELPMMLLGTLSSAHTYAQLGNLDEAGHAIARASELLLALKEAIANMPRAGANNAAGASARN
jgi:hypothetical protein